MNPLLLAALEDLEVPTTISAPTDVLWPLLGVAHKGVVARLTERRASWPPLFSEAFARLVALDMSAGRGATEAALPVLEDVAKRWEMADGTRELMVAAQTAVGHSDHAVFTARVLAKCCVESGCERELVVAVLTLLRPAPPAVPEQPGRLEQRVRAYAEQEEGGVRALLSRVHTGVGTHLEEHVGGMTATNFTRVRVWDDPLMSVADALETFERGIAAFPDEAALVHDFTSAVLAARISSYVEVTFSASVVACCRVGAVRHAVLGLLDGR